MWSFIFMSLMLLSSSFVQAATTSGGVQDNLTSLLTVLQSFSKSARAQAASVGELCDETTVNGHYTLCKAELDANPDVCGTQCQDALQYVADSCQYLIPEVTMDPETCYVNDTRAAGAPSSAASFGAAATVVASTVIMAAFIMI